MNRPGKKYKLIEEKFGEQAAELYIECLPVRHLQTVNLALALKQGLGSDKVVAIDVLHEIRDKFMSDPWLVSSRNSVVVDVIQGLDYALQALWGFKLDSDHHSSQHHINGCTCPKIDNDDLVGTKYRVRSQGCPFHGWEREENE